MFRLIGQVLSWLAGIYVASLLFCFLLEASVFRSDEVFNLRVDYAYSIYATPDHFAAYGLSRISETTRPRLLVLGGSVPGQAFVPSVLASIISDYVPQNLCLGGSSIRQIEQLLEIYLKSAKTDALKGAIVVLGGHPHSFIDDDRRPDVRRKRFDNERLRHKLFHDMEHCAKVWGRSYPLAFDSGKAIRPVLQGGRVFEKAT